MRHSLAHFHVLPVAELAAVEAAASRQTRPWFGVAPVDDALRTASGDVREFPREGIMTTWPLFYLSAREVVPFPERYFQATAAQRIAKGVELQDRRKTHAVLCFTAIDAAELRDAMSAVSATESDIFRYYTRQLQDALGVEAAQQRLREDATMPEVVSTCLEAFGWLLACIDRIDANSVGLLIVRDARRRRWRWLTRRCSGPPRRQPAQ